MCRMRLCYSSGDLLTHFDNREDLERHHSGWMCGPPTEVIM